MPSAISSPWRMSFARFIVDSARLLLVLRSAKLPCRPLDDGDQRLAAVLLEKLLIKGVDMVEAAVVAYGGFYARYCVNERLGLLAADDRAHERPGIHRRIVHSRADKRREIIIKLVLRRSAYIQRGNFDNRADSVLSVNYFSPTEYIVNLPYHILHTYNTTFPKFFPIKFSENFTFSIPGQ